MQAYRFHILSCSHVTVVTSLDLFHFSKQIINKSENKLGVFARLHLLNSLAGFCWVGAEPCCSSDPFTK